MEYKVINENFDLFEYCEELETAAENKYKFPLIKEIRQIIKDLKVKQKTVDFLKFSIEDLIKFRDRLYNKMRSLLRVNFVFGSNRNDSDVTLVELDSDQCFITDGVEFEDYDFSGYRECVNEYESRSFASKENRFSNSEELNWCLAIKGHAEKYNKKVLNGCGSKIVDHKFSRKNLLYLQDQFKDICDDIKPHLIRVYDEGRVKLCNKNNLMYLLINGHIDLKMSSDMISYFSKDQIMELNDYYGTDSDPYPLGFCWLNLFDEQYHDFLMQIYSPFMTATDIFKILQKHPNSVNLLSLDHIVYYRIVDGFGHFSFEPFVGICQFEISCCAFELLSELYIKENEFINKYAAEEARLRAMFSLVQCTEDFDDSYFSSEYFTFNFNREEIFVFGDVCHKSVLRYIKV